MFAFEAHAQSGLPLWTNQFRGFGPVDGADQANAIAVDSNGNAFVTGKAYTGSAFEFVTVAYTRGGEALWTNRYEGPANDDEAKGIAVGNNGNVFVTGFSIQNSNYPYNYDFATIAYSNAGNPLWTNRYNGTANGDDQASAIAVDSIGNVFVTGISAGNISPGDYVTLKYSNEGVPLWTNRYAASFYGGAAYALALSITTNGEVIVTGRDSISNNVQAAVTIKYSNDGMPQWTNSYRVWPANLTTANAVAVDGIGNAFVVGQWATASTENREYFTIKYSTNGLPCWTNVYSGPGDVDDRASAIVVDKDGNPSITAGQATIKYSNTGVPLWTNTLYGVQENAIGLDQGGHPFVTGEARAPTGGFEYITVAYSRRGWPLWTNYYSASPSADNSPIGLVVDRDGDVFVAGYQATVKYSPIVEVTVPLTFELRESGLVLSWTNAVFRLQSASEPRGPFTNVPAANSPYTNDFKDGQQFFRLIAE
jgi:hypothetical protein